MEERWASIARRHAPARVPAQTVVSASSPLASRSRGAGRETGRLADAREHPEKSGRETARRRSGERGEHGPQSIATNRAPGKPANRSPRSRNSFVPNLLTRWRRPPSASGNRRTALSARRGRRAGAVRARRARRSPSACRSRSQSSMSAHARACSSRVERALMAPSTPVALEDRPRYVLTTVSVLTSIRVPRTAAAPDSVLAPTCHLDRIFLT